MRKLKLELEDLAVQSFATDADRGARGTAHGHAYAYAYATLPDDGADTSVAPGDTEPGMNCFTRELSCGTRGC